MNSWKFVFVLLYCCGAFGAQISNATDKNSEDEHIHDSAEIGSIPDNMNIADYYYSIFGKHLDYDYREPLLTFDEPETNDLSDDIESEVDTTSDSDLWKAHSRKKRFILVPSNVYNATRRWYQSRRKLRMERRRLRAERRQRWQINRIHYLNARSESLRKQATRLSQLRAQQQQQRQQQSTRSVPEQLNAQTKNTATTVISGNNPATNSADADTAINPIASESVQVPVKQVPLPSKT